jgi:hypothetical protein
MATISQTVSRSETDLSRQAYKISPGQTKAWEKETGGRLPRSSRKVRKCRFESLALAPKMYVSPCQRDTSNDERVNRAWALRTYPQDVGVEQKNESGTLST